jgi:hypothetical protein
VPLQVETGSKSTLSIRLSAARDARTIAAATLEELAARLRRWVAARYPS